MHLTQLKEKIDGLLAQHGDVQLTYTHLRHKGTTLLQDDGPDPLAGADDEGDEPNPIADAETQAAENSIRKDLLLAIANGVAVEDRLAAAEPDDLIVLTYEELTQLLEYRAEYLATCNRTEPAKGPELVTTDLKTAAEQLGQVAGAAADKLPIGCPDVDVAKGACTLTAGHEGDHVWENPDAQLDATAKEVERELEAKKPAEG